MLKGPLLDIELLRPTVKDWSAYPFSIPAVSRLQRLVFHPSVTFLVGENGSGKSTFIEAVAIKAGFNAEGGTRHFRTSQRPSESVLHRHLRLGRGPHREKTGFFLRAETMFNISTEAEAYTEYGWDALHEKSHGEAFLWVAMNRFHGRGLYILDEPEAALSPQRQLTFLARMHQLVQSGSQFLISTHSPILMAYPNATIYALGPEGLTRTAYMDTEHYQVTRNFLAAPSRVLGPLLAPPPAEDDEFG